jgi:hypothetical protein
MTLCDGISRRLGSKPGKASVLVILHRLVFFEEWREQEQKYHFPDHESNQRTREYKTGMLTTTQGSWLASCLRKSECVVSPAH